MLKLQLPHPNTIYWLGGGCSLIIIDMDTRSTFAYAVNKMESTPVGDPCSFRIIEATWEALG
ncbi:MAG TPA: hypothetical protein VNX70_07990 [Bryobacteraceae bacterium]|nr:hypothetical protein [Bryobacteraceae bacterium]